MTAPPLVLASASPRRRRLLERLGLRPEVEPAEVDERARAGESPTSYVTRLALEKARAVANRKTASFVIGGDTAVVLDDEILGKPEGEERAIEMLLRLQGRTHRVETGVAVVAPGGASAAAVVGTDVRFMPFDRGRAEAYVATGEPLDKAGAYGIQGYGSVLVEEIHGDYFAVMGLPTARLIALLEELGWDYDFPEETQ